MRRTNRQTERRKKSHYGEGEGRPPPKKKKSQPYPFQDMQRRNKIQTQRNRKSNEDERESPNQEPSRRTLSRMCSTTLRGRSKQVGDGPLSWQMFPSIRKRTLSLKPCGHVAWREKYLREETRQRWGGCSCLMPSFLWYILLNHRIGVCPPWSPKELHEIPSHADTIVYSLSSRCCLSLKVFRPHNNINLNSA